MLEDYDEELEPYEMFDSADGTEGLEELIYEYSVHEPQLSLEELERLDAIADASERHERAGGYGCIR